MGKYLVLIMVMIGSHFFCIAREPDTIIRAKIIFSKEYVSAAWVTLKHRAPLFKEFGLLLVDKDPDVIFCSPQVAKDLNLLLQEVPLILLENDDYASLRPLARELLKNKSVKALFRNRTLKPRALYNEPICSGRYHFKLINDYAHLETPEQVEQLSRDQQLKIKCVLWDLRCSCYRLCSSYKNSFPKDFDNHRPIDVFFAGKTSFYAYKLYHWHRTKVLDIITDMKGIKKLIIEGNRPLPFDEYMENMRSSKIIVSPWGLGEWCYRDCEAIAAGAVLIKPDSSFLRALPNIYQKDITYVACKQDFSDLEEKITYVLAHYDEFKDMRKRAFEELYSGYDNRKICKDFVLAVRLALK